MIEIEVDKGQIAKVQFLLNGIKNGSGTVLMRAINKTLTGVKTDLDKETRKILNIKSSRVKDDMTVGKATKTRLNGYVSSSGRPVGLTNFTGTAQRAKGVSVSVRKDTPRKVIPGTFIAVGKNNNTHIFWRKYHQPTYSGDKFVYAGLPKYMRLPIETRYGPRIQDIQDDPVVINAVESKAGVRLKTNIDNELKYFLGSYNG